MVRDNFVPKCFRSYVFVVLQTSLNVRPRQHAEVSKIFFVTATSLRQRVFSSSYGVLRLEYTHLLNAMGADKAAVG